MSLQVKNVGELGRHGKENGQKVQVSLHQAVDKLRKRSDEGRQEVQASVLLIGGRFGIREETRQCRFKGEDGSLRGQLRTNRRSMVVQCCLNKGALLVSTCRCGWGIGVCAGLSSGGMGLRRCGPAALSCGGGVGL